MPYNLLLMPLLGGYCLLHIFNYTRFRAQRLDGYRLLLESACAGLLLVSVSRLAIETLNRHPYTTWLKSWWGGFSPFPYSGTAAGALILGLSVPWVANYFCSYKWAKNKILKQHGNALFKLLHRSVTQRKPVAITLDSGKYYMGYIAESPNLDPQEQYCSMIPLISGYRENDTQIVHMTSSYEAVYMNKQLGFDKNDFAITLPLSSIKTAHLFDQSAWREFHKQSRSGSTKTAGGSAH
jgi:hypothetical protein